MKLSIAIPDSALIDDSTQMDKSRKISEIARSCAIFGVDTIYVYQDGENQNDRSLLVTILKYLETPPFLRKRLFPRVNELKYAGVLHPLKIQSHVTPSNPKKIQVNDIREGIVVLLKGKKFVDAGINKLIPYYGPKENGKRITIQFKKGFPDFEIKEVSREQLKTYWGYIVKERTGLNTFLSTWEGKIIITSRKAKVPTPQQIAEIKNINEPLLIVFGSIHKGVHEILGRKLEQLNNTKVFNTFPNQNTETVRLEEAIIGTLSIFNFIWQ